MTVLKSVCGGPTEHALGPAHSQGQDGHLCMKASLCLCLFILICHCHDSAGIQHPVQHSVPPGLASGEPADERIWVQGKGVYFLPLKRSVWKVSRIKLACTLKNIFPF